MPHATTKRDYHPKFPLRRLRVPFYSISSPSETAEMSEEGQRLSPSSNLAKDDVDIPVAESALPINDSGTAVVIADDHLNISDASASTPSFHIQTVADLEACKSEVAQVIAPAETGAVSAPAPGSPMRQKSPKFSNMSKDGSGGRKLASIRASFESRIPRQKK